MVETRIGHLADPPPSTAARHGVPNPIRGEWFAGRHEARLGRPVGLSQFGVNHVTPRAQRAPRPTPLARGRGRDSSSCSRAELTLIDDNGEHPLTAGDYAGFPASAANAHHLLNRSTAPTTFLAVGRAARSAAKSSTTPTTRWVPPKWSAMGEASGGLRDPFPQLPLLPLIPTKVGTQSHIPTART